MRAMQIVLKNGNATYHESRNENCTDKDNDNRHNIADGNGSGHDHGNDDDIDDANDSDSDNDNYHDHDSARHGPGPEVAKPQLPMEDTLPGPSTRQSEAELLSALHSTIPRRLLGNQEPLMRRQYGLNVELVKV